jgi:large subunit ribosomal protein L6
MSGVKLYVQSGRRLGMSKIGRKPIRLDSIAIEIQGHDIYYKGPKGSGVYTLPVELRAQVTDGLLMILAAKNLSVAKKREINRIWGMHRALLANLLLGAAKELEKKIQIQGLGYKAVLSGKKVTFTLGFSHKVNFDLPDGISLTIDKSGQSLTLTSSDKELLGHVCSEIKALRKPEPYKGTGIRYAQEVIRRKAGKTKAA